MLVGMGTVFLFLSVLVMGMVLMSAIAQKFIPLAVEAEVSDAEVAAITAAIAQHKNKEAK